MSELLLQNIISVSKETIDKISELAPILIIAAIWLFGAIAKAVSAGKKGQQAEPEQKAKAKPRQPDFDDLVKIVKQRYAAAREQVKRETEGPSAMPRPAPQPHRIPVQPARFEAKTAPKLPYVEVTIPAVTPKVEKPSLEKPSMEQLAPSLAQEQLTDIVHIAEPHPYLAELAEQYTDPDGLRKAILHYEILGAPSR